MVIIDKDEEKRKALYTVGGTVNGIAIMEKKTNFPE